MTQGNVIDIRKSKTHLLCEENISGSIDHYHEIIKDVVSPIMDSLKTCLLNNMLLGSK